MNAFHEFFGESSNKVQRPTSPISKDWTIEKLIAAVVVDVVLVRW